jgi:hypothetical protein
MGAAPAFGNCAEHPIGINAYRADSRVTASLTVILKRQPRLESEPNTISSARVSLC